MSDQTTQFRQQLPRMATYVDERLAELRTELLQRIAQSLATDLTVDELVALGALLTTDGRLPTYDQKAALAGSYGTPSHTNPYVTQEDPAIAGPRIPTGAAGGVLSGTYPNPGFAVDMATQAELDTHTGLTTSAHGGIVASTDPRLTNARTPTAHHTSHESGGTDVIPHQSLSGAGTNTHAQIDTHIGLTTTAHGGIIASTDPRLTDARTPTGAAGGALGGTYPNPSFASANVTSLAGLTLAADKLPYATGVGTLALTDLPAYGRSLIDDLNASTARTTLGVVIGTDVQAYDAGLLSIAGLTTAANKTIYTTALDVYAVTDLSAFGRSLIDDADASAGRTTLGVVIGTNVQAYHAALQSISGLTTAADKMIYTTASNTYAVADLSSTARSLLDDTSISAMRTTLGVVIGTDVQAYDAELASVAGLISATDRLPYFTGLGTASLATFTSFARSLIDDPDSSTARTTLGLVIGTDVQGYDAELAAIAGLVSVNDRLPYFTGSGTASLATFTSFGRSLVDDADAAAGRVTLNIESRSTFSNVNYTAAATDRYVAQIGTLSASRTVTLPAASSVNAGFALTIGDESGSLTSTNTIVIARAGADTINGATSYTTSSPYFQLVLVSDGVSKWSYDVQGVGRGGTGGSTVATARANLRIDKRTTFSNADYTALTTDTYIAQVGTLSAARTVTLPAANAVNAGFMLTIADESGTVTASNTIILARAGSDTINGATSYTVITPYATVMLVSDGTSKWTLDVQGLTRGGTGATSAAGARTNLGLVIGTDVQAYNAALASIAGLTTAADKMIYTTASNTYAVIDLTAAARSLLDDTSVSAMRTTLGLVSGGAGDIWVDAAGDSMTGALQITLATGNSLIVDITTFVVDASNNRVGIRTASPAKALDVQGDAQINAGGSGGPAIFGTPGGGTGLSFINTNRAECTFDDTTLKFVVVAGTGAPPAANGFTINTSGQMGVGTASQANKFHVASSTIPNIHFDSNALAVFENRLGWIQIAGQDTASRAAGILLTVAPAAGDNHQWGIHHATVANGSRFMIGKNTSTAGGTNFVDIFATPSNIKVVLATDGRLGLNIGNANPANDVGIEVQYARTLSGNVTDGYSAGIQLAPTYNGAFTVTRHDYLTLKNPAGSATVTDAVVFRLDAAVGTHKATRAGAAIATTPATYDAFLLFHDGTNLYKIPAYLATRI